MMARDDAAAWARGLDAVVGRIGPRFGRKEPRRRATAYLKGLLAPVERKNGWQLAEAAGDRTPDGMQDFLARMRWDADLVRDDLRAYVVEHLGDPAAVLVLDETGFVKKGTKSVGVQRQYSGTAGRIETCQIGVFLGYASKNGRALIDRALYLPQSWTEDRARCREAGVPEDAVFTTKPKLGRQMLARALAAGVPCAWVVGDSVYGADYALRRWIESHGRGYVLTVTSGQRLGLARVDDWVADLPPTVWQRLSAGDGSKGPRLYDWAYVPYRSDAAPGWRKGLLVRRTIAAAPADKEKVTFYLTLAPAATPLAELVHVAGTRWTIEACFEAAKGEVGLDQYEVRSWTGWHRHITLAMLAHAYLTVLRKAAIGGQGRRQRRSQSRAAAAHAPRSAPAAVAPRLGTSPGSRCRSRLVALAATASAAGAPLALETANKIPA